MIALARLKAIRDVSKTQKSTSGTRPVTDPRSRSRRGLLVLVLALGVAGAVFFGQRQWALQPRHVEQARVTSPGAE
jgi:hypothetical protein